MATLEGPDIDYPGPACREHPLGCPQPGQPALQPPAVVRVPAVPWAPPPRSSHEAMRDEIRARRRVRGR